MAEARTLDGQMLAEAIAMEDAGEALEMVRGLLESGVDANARGWDGSHALPRAVSDERWEIARLLLEHGAHRPSDFRFHEDPLFGLAVDGPLALLDTLLSRCGGWACMIMNRNGEPCVVENPITVLVSRGDLTRLADLWDRGVKALINVPSYDLGQTPLVAAVADSEIEHARMLIGRGADVNAYFAFCDSCTALDHAVRNLDVEMVRWLLGAGANPNFAHGYKLPLLDARPSPFGAEQTEATAAKARQIYELMRKKAKEFPPPIGQDGRPIKPWPPEM